LEIIDVKWAATKELLYYDDGVIKTIPVDKVKKFRYAKEYTFLDVGASVVSYCYRCKVCGNVGKVQISAGGVPDSVIKKYDSKSRAEIIKDRCVDAKKAKDLVQSSYSDLKFEKEEQKPKRKPGRPRKTPLVEDKSKIPTPTKEQKKEAEKAVEVLDKEGLLEDVW